MLNTKHIISPNGEQETWQPNTLATTLVCMVQKAEEWYGPKAVDANLYIVGPEFYQGPVPRIAYTAGYGIVQIPEADGEIGSEDSLYYGLAQEALHMLGPTAPANRLEEGVSILFAERYMEEVRGVHIPRVAGVYADATTDVEVLINGDQEQIRRLREKNSFLTRLTEKDIQAVCPGASAELINRLRQQF